MDKINMKSKWLHFWKLSIGVSMTTNVWALGPVVSKQGASLQVGPFGVSVYRRSYGEVRDLAAK